MRNEIGEWTSWFILFFEEVKRLEMKVCLKNPSKNSRDQATSAWFDLPVNREEIAEMIGVTKDYEEYTIVDYESPVTIYESTSIEELNKTYQLFQEIAGTPIAGATQALINTWFRDLEELVENSDGLNHFPECETMADVARYYHTEGLVHNGFQEILEQSEVPIDYDKIGKALERTGNFLVTPQGIFEDVL